LQVLNCSSISHFNKLPMSISQFIHFRKKDKWRWMIYVFSTLSELVQCQKQQIKRFVCKKYSFLSSQICPSFSDTLLTDLAINGNNRVEKSTYGTFCCGQSFMLDFCFVINTKHFRYRCFITCPFRKYTHFLLTE